MRNQISHISHPKPWVLILFSFVMTFALLVMPLQRLKASAKNQSVRSVATVGELSAPLPTPTLVVNSTADTDDGSCTADPLGCTLREAINAANSVADANTISFNIPGGGVQTIAPATVLPVITQTVTIDGLTQPGASLSSRLIQISGENLSFPASGFDIQASNVLIRGMVINRFPFTNVFITSGTLNRIESNIIGLDPTGTSRNDNTSTGVYVLSDFNTIGNPGVIDHQVIAGHDTAQVRLSGNNNIVAGNYIGTNAAGTGRPINASQGQGIQIGGDSNTIGGSLPTERNVISGNRMNGIWLTGSSLSPTSSNVIAGNYIGVDVTGATRLANDGNGILLQGNVTLTNIGLAGAGNVISGNGTDFGGDSFAGIAMRTEPGDNSKPSANVIQANFIGTNAAGTAAIGVIHSGIELSNSFNNTIGGTAAGERNVISGNRYGIAIFGPNATGNSVQGNYIGLQPDGVSSLPNRDYGVFISSTAANNTIGGTGAGEGNTIAFNGSALFGGAGVRTDQFGGGNSIRGNSIHGTANDGLGIDLDISGVNANDAGDADANAGGDTVQNFPVITSTDVSSSTITGTLNTTPNSTSGYDIDFFENASCDPSGNGEGQTYLGSMTTGNTDANGDVGFVFNPAALADGQFVTATATAANGHTSELSVCFAEDTTPPIVTPNVTGTLGNNDWYTSDVGVSWTVTDAESNVSSQDGCDVQNVIADTDGVTFTCSATSGGGTRSESATVKRDATAPVISFDSQTPANVNGWNNTNVVVSWNCSDALSDVVNSTTGQTISTEGENQSATGTCEDNAGNTASATQGGIYIDKTAPNISLDSRTPANANGWNNTNVLVSWNCSDALSDVLYSTTGQIVSGEGQNQSATDTCEDYAGNTASDTQNGISIDKTAPTLSPAVLPNPVSLGGSATASANASDTLSGISSQSCGAPDTSTAGNKTVNCTATDLAGNTANATAGYTVNGPSYNFTGFFQPVDNLPTLNVVNAGSSIPVKFSLGGNFGLNIFAPGYPASGITACNSSSPADAIEETVSAGGSSLTYDAASDRYHYVWKTEKSWKGQCRVLLVKLNDGNTYIVQFRFK
jgi:CSLREA domain-containing protein